MTSDEKYKITEEDIKKYGGEGMCCNLEECNRTLDSEVCSLIRGYNHPQCPVNIAINKELLKDPEYVKRQESIRQLIDHTKRLLEELREDKEREGKKTE